MQSIYIYLPAETVDRSLPWTVTMSLACVQGLGMLHMYISQYCTDSFKLLTEFGVPHNQQCVCCGQIGIVLLTLHQDLG